jgi:deoxyribodipyrimidine photo-lyase
MMRALYWFREDLRLLDNPALTAMTQKADEAVFVFVIPSGPEWSQGEERMGDHRRRFMLESLADLDRELRGIGQQLRVLQGNPVECVLQTAKEWNCQAVFSQRCHTGEETQSAESISTMIPHHVVEGSTLVHPEDLPFAVEDLPEIFSRFRNKVEKRGLDIRPEFPIPKLPPPPQGMESTPFDPDGLQRLAGLPEDTMCFEGGALTGWKRLQHYFWGTHSLSSYKQTRNGMLGWDYSSKFSPWLALGCMSPRSIYHAIRRYEEEEGSNESTYWLIFELLWRDYFRFVAMQHGNRIWHATGLKESARNPVSHHPLQWKAWCTGTTRSPFVNANMHELRLTGFMSNRGRQNVASYAIHDLGLDWRACAEWFEHWLIDFDPCSNTGNWLYVAGIGNDPRPQRKFDVDWQAERYDADGAYQSHWNRLGGIFPLDPDAVP